MIRRAEHGYTLVEFVVALALSGIVAVLVGSLFIGSLSAWRRGRDLRETQLQAVGLVDLMARDIRNAIRATGVTSRPHLVTDDGDPILLLSAKASGAADGSTAWILYLFFPDRGEVLRQVVVASTGGSLETQESRVVGTGIVRISVESADTNGVQVEVEVRRGRATAQARVTASPRNP